MAEIIFKKPESWACPECFINNEKYYIQDRYLYGSCYEYALFKKAPVKSWKFNTVEDALCFVYGVSLESLKKHYLTEIIGPYKSISQMGVEYGVTRDGLVKEIKQDERLTGWFPYYDECLAQSKKLLSKLMPEQLTLF